MFWSFNRELSKHDVDGSENVIWKCNFAFLQLFFNYSNYPGIKFEPALGTYEDKIEHLSSYADVVHTTAKQVISRRRKNENVFKMLKDEKCTCKACKTIVFHCKKCKFVGFLLPSSSSWFLKLPYDRRKKLSWDKQYFLIFRFCIFQELKSKAVVSALLPYRKKCTNANTKTHM